MMNDPPPPGTYWVTEGALLAGKHPSLIRASGPVPGNIEPAHQGVSALLAAGVDSFVDLTEPAETAGRLTPYHSFVVARNAISTRHSLRDFAAPDRPTMVDILDSIDEQLAAARTVYVHCWAGIGRTGTVVGCWLVRHGLATTHDVFDALDRLRAADAERGHLASPENARQRKLVAGWTVNR